MGRHVQVMYANMCTQGFAPLAHLWYAGACWNLSPRSLRRKLNPSAVKVEGYLGAMVSLPHSDNANMYLSSFPPLGAGLLHPLLLLALPMQPKQPTLPTLRWRYHIPSTPESTSPAPFSCHLMVSPLACSSAHIRVTPPLGSHLRPFPLGWLFVHPSCLGYCRI